MFGAPGIADPPAGHRVGLGHAVAGQRPVIKTRLDLRGALIGKRPCPADEIWLRDSDLVVVPKSAILLTDDFIELVFTRGIYGVVPFSTTATYSQTRILP